MVILTEGHSNTHTAKTACSIIRYRPEEVDAVLDSTKAPTTTDCLLGVGAVPVVASLDQAPLANTLVIGIAPPGGRIPPAWRATILQAISRGMDVVSGLHDFLSDDPQIAAAAQRSGVRLWDVRKNQEKTIARRVGLDDSVTRVHTVGHDCSIGKMVVAIEVTRALQQRGRRATFLATGQTGIMVSGDGAPIDCVVADFVSGAAEQLVLRRQAGQEFLLIEGQGSLVHPSYSGVTLALLHGCHPHALILCAKMGRTHITGLDLEIPPLRASGKSSSPWPVSFILVPSWPSRSTRRTRRPPKRCGKLIVCTASFNCPSAMSFAKAPPSWRTLWRRLPHSAPPTPTGPRHTSPKR